MVDIPPEAQDLKNQFLREEAARKAARDSARAAKDAERILKGKDKDSKEPRVKVMSCGEAERRAIACGCTIESGNGRHGKHIVGPDGKRRPLPDHGSGDDLSVGVTRELIKFFKSYNTPKR